MTLVFRLLLRLLVVAGLFVAARALGFISGSWVATLIAVVLVTLIATFVQPKRSEP